MTIATLNLYAISGALAFLTNVSLALYILVRGDRSKANTLWSFTALSVGLFGFGIFQVAIATTVSTATIWWRVAHVGVILIPVMYYNFLHVFLGFRGYTSAAIVNGFALLLILATTGTNYLVGDLRFVFDQFYYVTNSGPLYTPYVIFFIGTLGYIHFILWRASHRQSIDRVKRQQIRYFFIATLIGLLGGLTNFLVSYGIDIYPYGNFSVALYPIVMTYAILRFNLFNVKAIIAEILVFILWLFLIVKILTDTTVAERTLDLVFLILTIIIGVFLVRSVLHETSQRERQQELTEQLKVLTSKLKHKVSNQDTELEERAKRLEILLEQKSDLITLVAHQLRTPLTALKWIGQSFSDADLTKLNVALSTDILKLNKVVNKMVIILDDILNVLKIEEGKFGFSFKPKVSMAAVIDNVLDSYRLVIEGKGIHLSVSIAESLPPIKADAVKLRIAFENIITNAIKYTPKDGQITIKLSRANDTVILRVKDTGIGIENEDKEHIFSKLFRGKSAYHTAPEGTGLGLYIAQNIIQAHGGAISFTSQERTGTEFIISLPLPERDNTWLA